MHANELIKRKSLSGKTSELDPLAMVHFNLCVCMSGYVPIKDFMNMEVDQIATYRSLYSESVKDLNKRKN